MTTEQSGIIRKDLLSSPMFMPYMLDYGLALMSTAEIMKEMELTFLEGKDAAAVLADQFKRIRDLEHFRDEMILNRTRHRRSVRHNRKLRQRCSG